MVNVLQKGIAVATPLKLCIEFLKQRGKKLFFLIVTYLLNIFLFAAATGEGGLGLSAAFIAAAAAK